MAHDVFVSYSNKNKAAADAVCATLEANGVRCWIAPRDVTPGLEWGESIVEAIEQSRIMVLVFTADANASHQIRREVERAVNRGVIILPLRIEDVLPARALEFFIGNVHWLDALTPPLESHLRNLTESVKALLARPAPGTSSLRVPSSGNADDPTGGPTPSSAQRQELSSSGNASRTGADGMQLRGTSGAEVPVQAPASSRNQLPPAGGAVPADSPFYVERQTDQRLAEALERGDGLVLLNGAREMGKTSALVRALLRARRAGKSTVFVDLQKMPQSAFANIDSFRMEVCKVVADGLGIEWDLGKFWNPELPASYHFERFLRREVLRKTDRSVIIAMDEVDRLLSYPFAQEVFGSLRSLHNERAMDPDGPWNRLTLVVAYCTDAHLLIPDHNQSPFNVGTKIQLLGFSFEQVESLNELNGRPIRSSEEMHRFYDMFNGHPYLTQLAFREMIQRGISVDELLTTADADSGPFGDHLGVMLTLLNRNEELLGEVRGMLDGRPISSLLSFYRLRSAGILTGGSSQDARFGCVLYRMCLARHFGSPRSRQLDAPGIENAISPLRESPDRPIRIQ